MQNKKALHRSGEALMNYKIKSCRDKRIIDHYRLQRAFKQKKIMNAEDYGQNCREKSSSAFFSF